MDIEIADGICVHAVSNFFPPEALTFAEFEKLWALHPEEFGTFSFMGRTVPTPRWQQPYFFDYTFGGVHNKAATPPADLQPWFSYVQTHFPEINQMMVNWYQDGLHYIGPHSDNPKPLVEGSQIITVSLGETRVLRFRQNKNIVRDIELTHGTLLVMPWEANLNFTHEIVKTTRPVGRRICINFRTFKIEL